MKVKLTTYLFVFLYIVAMLRPVSPFVEYAVNYDYISKVLCINKDKPEMNCKGTCHLMQELTKQENKDFNSLRILIEDYPIGFVELANTHLIHFKSIETKKIHYYQQKYTFIVDNSIFHPPTFFI